MVSWKSVSLNIFHLVKQCCVVLLVGRGLLLDTTLVWAILLYHLDWCSSHLCSAVACTKLFNGENPQAFFSLSWLRVLRGPLHLHLLAPSPFCHAPLTPAPLASTCSLFVPTSDLPQGLCTSCSCCLVYSPWFSAWFASSFRSWLKGSYTYLI